MLWLFLLCVLGCNSESTSSAFAQTKTLESSQNITGRTFRKEGFIPQKTLNENKTHPPIIKTISEFQLTDQTGVRVNRESFYNYIWVINFVSADCDEICELQTRLMSGLQKLLAPEIGPSIRFVSIMKNTEQYKADTIKNFIKSRKLDSSQWQILSSSNEDVLKFSNNFIHHKIKTPAQDLDQLNTALFIVDWEGRLRGKYDIILSETLSVKNNIFTKFKEDLANVFIERKILPESLLENAKADPRAERQKARAKSLDIFTDFSLTDKIKDSGITFQHKIVNDVGINYKAIHYDHGNGMAIADIDGDGWEDIYFTTLSGTNELWRNRGDGTFENITDRAGLNISDRIGMAASFGDIDNDGDPDLYISNIRAGNILFENDGTGKFKDITKSSSTGVKAHSSGTIFFDYDKDGLLDLFVTNVGKYTTDTLADVTLYSAEGQVTSEYTYYVGYKDAFAGHLKPERNETSILFKNMGNNRFEDVTKELGLVNNIWSGDATIIDGNNDGWPDLYIVNMQGNDEYYENQQGKAFNRKSRDIFEKTPWGSMGLRSFDYDNDGDMDLYVTDMHSDMREYIGIEKEKLKSNVQDPESFLKSGGNSIFGNAFYENNGDGSFTEISDKIGVENYWPWGPSTGDLNADGYEDLFIASSMAYPFRYHINSVLLNDQGKGFIDSEYKLGVEPRRAGIISKPWFEIDCENTHKSHLVCVNSNTPTSSRTVVWGALGSRSAAIFDLDQDGDQDIVTLEFNHEPMVLINNISDKRDINYLRIKLNGTKSNRNGIGAVVKLYAGDHIYTKVNDGNSGYLGQSVAPLYFGLANNKKINKIEVVWPSGIRQVLSDDLTINGLMNIIEPPH